MGGITEVVRDSAAAPLAITTRIAAVRELIGCEIDACWFVWGLYLSCMELTTVLAAYCASFSETFSIDNDMFATRYAHP